MIFEIPMETDFVDFLEQVKPLAEDDSRYRSGGGRGRGGRGRGAGGRGAGGRGARGRRGVETGMRVRAREGARGGRGGIGRQLPPVGFFSWPGPASGLPPSSQTLVSTRSEGQTGASRPKPPLKRRHEAPPGGPPNRRRLNGSQDTGDGAGPSGGRHQQTPHTLQNELCYNESVLSEAQGECVICMEDLLPGETVARLPCFCLYHKRCIENWFGVQSPKKTCPVHFLDSTVSALLIRPS